MTIIQTLISAVSPQALQTVAGALGEPTDRARQGLLDAIPAMLSGIIGKGSTSSGAASLISLMQDPNVDPALVDRFAAGAQAPTDLMRSGDSIAHSMLGPRMDQTTDAIAQHAGVSRGAAHSLLALAAPLALGGIARSAPRGGFTPESLLRFLQGQREDVYAMLPAGVSGFSDLRRPELASEDVSPRVNWLPWAAAAGVGALLAFALAQCMNQRTAVVEAPTITAPTAPRLSDITLPGGVRLSVPSGSVGDQLAAFLAGSSPAPRTFAFQNLKFDSGRVVVTPESTATLDAIAKILNAYPNTRVRLEGHTDNVGDRAANLALSLERSRAVADALSTRGVSTGRLTAAGFGPDKPIATNDTPEGRAQNRRLELTVEAR